MVGSWRCGYEQSTTGLGAAVRWSQAEHVHQGTQVDSGTFHIYVDSHHMLHGQQAGEKVAQQSGATISPRRRPRQRFGARLTIPQLQEAARRSLSLHRAKRPRESLEGETPSSHLEVLLPVIEGVPQPTTAVGSPFVLSHSLPGNTHVVPATGRSTFLETGSNAVVPIHQAGEAGPCLQCAQMSRVSP